MAIISKTAQTSLAAKLKALGLSEGEVTETLALLAPKPRTPGQLPVRGLASAANAVTDKLLCEAAGMTVGEALSRSAIKHANTHGTSEGMATLLGKLEGAIAAGELAKTVTSKAGNVSPSSATKALMRLKGICALTDD